MFSTYDRAGGAEKVALDLQSGYRKLGHDARLFVRFSNSHNDSIYEIDPYIGTKPWSSFCRFLEFKLRLLPAFRGQYWLVNFLRNISWPKRGIEAILGSDNFSNPSTSKVLDTIDNWRPDVIHAHNLHSYYFDLSALSILSKEVPFVWTMHDTWAITGHCGHFIDCKNWETGCGDCPDLKRPPAILRDSTAKNFQFKKNIYEESSIVVTTPSEWLFSYLSNSILKNQDLMVVPNGVDLSIFRPANRALARQELGLPQEAFICLYSSFYGPKSNPYKDFDTVKKAIAQITSSTDENSMFFICIGNADPKDYPNSRYTGYISDENKMAKYYQAGDVLLHAANAENFPLVILEAMACGTPVIATNVGGISEQIVDSQTGYLVSQGDSNAMAERVFYLLEHQDICKEIGKLASLHVCSKFGLVKQVETFLTLFDNLLDNNYD